MMPTQVRKVLITGGAGFIGSTVASACADSGIEPVILDDLSTGLRSFGERFPFYAGDYGDRALIRRVLADHPDLTAVVHCAAHIVVPESVADPLRYYENNVAKLVPFLDELSRSDCRRIVFSSSASVYRPADEFVVDEASPLEPSSPYAASKAMAERILADAAAAGRVQAIALRYFNPVGADPQYRTGLQLPVPSHALGQLLTADAAGRAFTVTGTDWPTRDGSGLRDYVHVWDLALAHVAALVRFDTVLAGDTTALGYDVINLGTGTGTTVFELVDAFTEVTGRPPLVELGPRRPGDVAGCVASADKALAVLDWQAERTLQQGIADSLAWSRRLGDVLTVGLSTATPTASRGGR